MDVIIEIDFDTLCENMYSYDVQVLRQVLDTCELENEFLDYLADLFGEPVDIMTITEYVNENMYEIFDDMGLDY